MAAGAAKRAQQAVEKAQAALATAQNTLTSVHEEIRPLLAKANAIAEEASRTAALATAQAQKVDRVVTTLAARVGRDLVARAAGVRHAGAREPRHRGGDQGHARRVARGCRLAPAHQPFGREDPLFIGESPGNVMRHIIPGTGASRLAALLIAHLCPISSLFAPCQTGAALRDLRNASRFQGTSAGSRLAPGWVGPQSPGNDRCDLASWKEGCKRKKLTRDHGSGRNGPP